jgi:hypothetical protein
LRQVAAFELKNALNAFQQKEVRMHTRRKLLRGDAFDRAIRETFGETTTFAKVEEARRLYARYRTDDVLNRLKKLARGDNGGPQPWL